MLSGAFSAGCKSASSRANARVVHPLRKISFYNVRVRRPAGPGADPQAGPGGTDYRSSPRPDSVLDCREPGVLISSVSLGGLSSCLASIQSPVEVLYRLERLPEPYLELEDPEDAPKCLAGKLPRILLPREIFFPSDEEGQLSCYSARLALEADEALGVRLPIAKAALKLELPLKKPPAGEEQARRLLFAWIYSMFLEDGVVRAHVVPDSICRQCFTEKEMLGPFDPEPMPWP